MKAYIDDLPATLAAMWARQPTRRSEIIGMLTEFVAAHPVAHRECPLAARMVNLSAKAKPAKAKRHNIDADKQRLADVNGLLAKLAKRKFPVAAEIINLSAKASAKCEQKRAREQK